MLMAAAVGQPDRSAALAAEEFFRPARHVLRQVARRGDRRRSQMKYWMLDSAAFWSPLRPTTPSTGDEVFALDFHHVHAHLAGQEMHARSRQAWRSSG
jgi:hypothetical protein